MSAADRLTGHPGISLEDRLASARTVLWAVAERLATAQSPGGAVVGELEPELVAGGLDTLATMATGMAAEARTGMVAW